MPLVEPAAAPVLAAAVSSMMASGVISRTRVRGHHLITLALSNSLIAALCRCAGVYQSIRGAQAVPCAAVRGGEQRGKFVSALPNVL